MMLLLWLFQFFNVCPREAILFRSSTELHIIIICVYMLCSRYIGIATAQLDTSARSAVAFAIYAKE